MFVIGIISVPKKRTSLGGRLLGRVTIKERFGSDPVYIVAETAAGERDIAEMRRASLIRLMRRAEKKLRATGAEAVLTAENCREYAPFLKERVQKSYSIPKAKIFDGFWAALKKTGSDVLKSVLIIDRELSATSYEKLEDLCPIVRNIRLSTMKTERAEEMAEELFFEYGIFVQVENSSSGTDERVAQAVIDVDDARLRVGDFCIDGAEFRSKSGSYNLNSAEVAGCLGQENMLDIEKWISGKRTIKIS